MHFQASISLCLLVFSVFLLSGCSTPQFIENQIAEDIYGLLYPASNTQSKDVVIMLCGGSGFHEQYIQVADFFTHQDYYVVIIDYYGGGDDWGGYGIDSRETLERYHQNVQNGINWVKNDSGIEPENLFILGFSYGATIGINTASARNDIKSVTDFYGDIHMGVHDNLSPSEFVAQLPPVLLIYGDQDRVVTTDEGTEMMQLLEQYGIPHQEYIVPGMEHGFITDYDLDGNVRECLEITDSWFRKYSQLESSK